MKNTINPKRKKIIISIVTGLILLALIVFCIYAYQTKKFYWFNRIYYGYFTSYRKYNLYNQSRLPYVSNSLDNKMSSYLQDTKIKEYVPNIQFQQVNPVVKSIDSQNHTFIGIMLDEKGVPYEDKFGGLSDEIHIQEKQQVRVLIVKELTGSVDLVQMKQCEQDRISCATLLRLIAKALARDFIKQETGNDTGRIIIYLK